MPLQLLTPPIVSQSNVWTANQTFASGTRLILPQDNSEATPTFAFGDGNTGFHESSDNLVRFVSNGSNVLILDANGLTSNVTTGGGLLNTAATTTTTTIRPNRSDDSGLGQNAADQLSLIAGGFEILRLTENTALANYVGALFDAADQVDLTSANGSTWRLIQTQAVTVDWDGGTLITANQGSALHLGTITHSADQATTITDASTLHVSVVTEGGNITITNNRMISTGVSDCFLTVGGVWTDTVSTTKVKREIEDLDWTKWDMHELIGQLHPITWRYNKHFKNDFDRQRYGIAAEDFPDFLKVPGELDPHGVSGSVMANFALAGLSYQQARIDELEKKIAVLEAR